MQSIAVHAAAPSRPGDQACALGDLTRPPASVLTPKRLKAD